MHPMSAAIAVFILIVACAGTLYLGLDGARRGDHRLGALNRKASLDDAAGAPWRQMGRQFVALIRRRVASGSAVENAPPRLRRELNYAGFVGVEWPAIFRLVQVITSVILGLIGFGVGWAFGMPALASALVCGSYGIIAPSRYLKYAARKRQLRIARELPVMLDLLVVCLEAGIALGEALRIVARDCLTPSTILGAEIRTSVAEMNTGASLSDALEHLGERTGSEDLRAIATLLIQSERLGTRLGPALRAGRDQMAARRRLLAEERAQKSSIKMLGPLVLFILPAMLMVVLGPAFIQLLQILHTS